MKASNEPLWTIEELGKRTAGALAVGYEGPPNDRVREVPDLRTIRYYTTLGLIDRPRAMRGRTALYGRRHLHQLVAIKRLQAKGLSLADVQRQLVGLTAAALARVARVPPAIEKGGEAAAPEPEARRLPPERESFWRAEPAPVRPQRDGERRRAAAAHESELHSAAWPLQGINLGPGATLLLAAGRPVNEDDLEAIRKAAGPLIELLQTRRLLSPREERKG